LYNEDNKDVYNLLSSLTLDGPGETYIRQFQATRNGRGAYLALDEHFSGGSYSTTKVNNAWRTLRDVRYDGKKSNMDFATFRQTYDEAFRDLEEGGEGLKDPSKVTHLLAGIMGETSSALENMKNTVLNDVDTSRNYTLACNFFARCISNNPNLDKIAKGRQISYFNANSNPNSNSTQGRLPHHEWNALSYSERAEIRRKRRESDNTYQGERDNHEQGGRVQGGRYHNRGRGGRDGRTSGRGRFAARGQGGRGRDNSHNGRGRGGGAKRNISMVSHDNEDDEQYYEDDDYEYEYGEEDDVPIDQPNQRHVHFPDDDHKRTRSFRAIERVDRHISDVDASEPSQPYSRAEMDSHADNCVVGRDALILEEYPDQSYRVYGYRKTDGFIERHIVKAALAVDLEGETIVLIINQCFADPHLQHSLINPNQVRSFGHVIHDVPTQFDKNSPFCMSLKDGITIPFKNRG
jgi:hypothetical protein